MEDGTTSIKLSLDWLEKSLDYPSILQNLIYLLGLVDNQFRFSGLVDREEDGVFERYLTMKEKNEYPISVAFKQKEMIYTSLIMTYMNFLEMKDIHFEELFGWFFSEYLVNEYGIENFDIKVPEKNNSYYQKNVLMHLQFHRAMKKYFLYEKYGEINQEMVFESSIPRISELRSLSKRKYIYFKNQEFITYSNRLFSDQSVFGYLEETGYNIGHRILNGVSLADIDEYDSYMIHEMIENSVLKKEKDKFYYTSTNMYILLNQVFHKHTINYYWIPDEFRVFIDSQEKNLEFHNYLFSKEEASYFDYYLSDKFSNGMSLRNKYAHGVTEDFSEELHKQNYVILMYLFNLLIIKLNEEFNYKFDFLSNE